jgi:hypothetical protein
VAAQLAASHEGLGSVELACVRVKNAIGRN